MLDQIWGIFILSEFDLKLKIQGELADNWTTGICLFAVSM